MSARDVVLGSIRQALGVRGEEAPRRFAVEERIARHPRGIVPARGQLTPAARVKLFVQMVESMNGSARAVDAAAAIPAAAADYLRAKNLPMKLRRGADPRLEAMPWHEQKTLEASVGRSDGRQAVGLSYAFAAAAETGTLVLVSGPENPTTLNFLPEHHLVAIDAKDIVGDYETVWQRLRKRFGEGKMPRTVNWISGPSRSGDIEQTQFYGAHGPKFLHVLIVGKP
jgi:L-lactate dehydrogenase complex protein LldG